MIYAILKPTVSAATDFVADYDLQDLQHFGVQATFTGSDVAGTFKIQKSIDGVVFVDIPLKSTAVTASAPAVLDDEANYRFVRVNWDYTSGTGNITVVLAAKDNPMLLNN